VAPVPADPPAPAFDPADPAAPPDVPPTFDPPELPAMFDPPELPATFDPPAPCVAPVPLPPLRVVPAAPVDMPTVPGPQPTRAGTTANDREMASRSQ